MSAMDEERAARYLNLCEQRRCYHGIKPVMKSRATMLGVGLFLLALFTIVLLVIITSPL